MIVGCVNGLAAAVFELDIIINKPIELTK